MTRIRKKINVLLQTNLPLKERLLNIAKTYLKATVDIDMDGFMKGIKNTLSVEQQKKINQAEVDMYQTIENAFIEAINQKEIREINPMFATHAYLSLLKVGYTNNGQEQIYQTVEEVAEQIIELFWRGIGG
ncbi:hypothetical protein ELQ35_15900 [Peribacillus cavernae]|uniref:Uncharacterized protein n=1 Tax=Peribacillus cavernae TaxID=1674310 RepID=A0A433HGE3_9BACI|nr:hypothetical protein [Peribacillus cavernae]RUQ27350.1 hypothetical protein ELQ35_15900 [Peribacillus cavernae]